MGFVLFIGIPNFFSLFFYGFLIKGIGNDLILSYCVFQGFSAICFIMMSSMHDMAPMIDVYN
jgi:hypothetical protein